MIVDSPTSLLEQAHRFGLISRDMLDNLLHRPDTPMQDLTALSQFLVDRQLLTSYQVQRLLAGLGDHLIFGGYRILESFPLTTDGTGNAPMLGPIERAIHPQLHTPVQLRRLIPHAMPPLDSLQSFLSRAQIAAQVRDAHLVNVIDAGILEGQPFLVSEALDGQDLLSRIRSNGAMSVSHACRLIHPIAVALSRVHAAGITHGDIRPGVIIVAPAGIAKLAELGHVPITGPIAGPTSKQYGDEEGHSFQPRERFREAVPTPAGDVYGLASVLTFMLVGQLATSGLRAKSQIAWPSGLMETLRLSLSHTPTERPTAAEFAARLRPFMDDPRSEEISIDHFAIPEDVPLASLTMTSSRRGVVLDAELADVDNPFDAEIPASTSEGVMFADPVSGVIPSHLRQVEVDVPVAFVPTFQTVPSPEAYIPGTNAHTSSNQTYVPAMMPYTPPVQAYVPHMEAHSPQAYAPHGYPWQPPMALEADDDPYAEPHEDESEEIAPRPRKAAGNWQLWALMGGSLHLLAMLLLAAFFMGWFDRTTTPTPPPPTYKKSRLPAGPSSSLFPRPGERTNSHLNA